MLSWLYPSPAENLSKYLNKKSVEDLCIILYDLLFDFVRFIMAELLQTERAYVKDLETCINCYLREMRNDRTSVPPALQGKVYKSFLCISNTILISFYSALLYRCAMPVAILIFVGGNNIRQYRRDLSFPRARIPTRIGQIRDDARRCWPLLCNVGARVQHVRVVLPQQTGQQRRRRPTRRRLL